MAFEDFDWGSLGEKLIEGGSAVGVAALTQQAPAKAGTAASMIGADAGHGGGAPVSIPPAQVAWYAAGGFGALLVIGLILYLALRK